MYRSNYICSFDGLRVLACFSIILFHLHVIGAFSEINFFRSSSLFVELFFVISGFCFWISINSKEQELSTFIKKRLIRLYPIHLIITLFYLIGEITKYVMQQHLHLSMNHAAFTDAFALKELLPNLLLIQSWLPNFDSLSFNSVSWFISILFWASVIYFVLFKYIGKWILLFAIVWIVVYVVSFYWPIPLCFLRGLANFSIGIVTAFVIQNISFTNLNSKLLSLLELIMLVCIVVVLSISFDKRAIYAMFMFAAITAIFSLNAGAFSNWFSSSIFKILSKRSYAIYMVQGIVAYVLTAVFIIMSAIFNINFTVMRGDVRFFDMQSSLANNVFPLLVLVLTVMAGEIVYRFNNYITNKSRG